MGPGGWNGHEVELKARLLDALGAAVVATDAEYRIRFWGTGAERLYGWTRTDVVGKPITDVLHPGSADEPLLRPLRATDGATTARAAEMGLQHKTGGRVEVLAITVPLVEDGRMTGTLGVSIDIGAQKAVQRELREARDFLTAITDNMAEGMIAVDGQGHAVFANAAAERLLGWPATALIGVPIHDVTHFERRDGTPYPPEECPLTQVRRTGIATRVERDAFIASDGSRVDVSYSASPWHDGSTAGIVVVFEDISESVNEEFRVQLELDKLAWIGRIEDALAADRFLLYAQPVLQLSDHSVSRYELLIRMKDVTGSIILPNLFLPTAEEYGLIQRIDQWVIRQACELAAVGHTVALNVSAKSMTKPLIGTLRDELTRLDVPPERLICEITETALIRAIGVGETFVTALRELGCQVALDDFGAGYAGFSYLKRLPVTFLKIDTQFVRDLATEPASRHVVVAIVNLARDFGIKTIAEGAEDWVTVDMLKELGVDYAQGFAIAAPAPVDEILGRAYFATGAKGRGSPAP